MSLFFKNRDGQTPIDHSLIQELKLDYIQDMTELYEQERGNIAEAIIWLDSTKSDHCECYLWIELHKKMYCNVWKFAGKIRTTELNNPDFDMPYNIRTSLSELSKDLKIWLIHNTYPDKELAGIFHEKLLTIHPFKDGNGRWARVLTQFICKKEGKEIPSWGIKIKNDELRRTSYIDAVKMARKSGEYKDLIYLMFDLK